MFSNEVYLKIIYNQTLNVKPKNLRPDFSFIFKCKEEERIFYLDAKFHDYNKNKLSFGKDINDTAIEKYHDKLINTEYSSSGSFILHCNNDYKFIDFGGDCSVSHKYGSFPITPGNYSYFSTWISMIIEWFYDEYNICWRCGDINPDAKGLPTYGNGIKYHYKCKKCGDFWVKNHCGKCSCDKIIKHDLPHKQYHELTQQKWMLKCPKCGYGGYGEINSSKSRTYTIVSNEDEVSEFIPIFDDTIDFTPIDNYIFDDIIDFSPIDNDKIEFIPDSGKVCPRCHGSGYLGKYNHIENGVCFRCNGVGSIY